MRSIVIVSLISSLLFLGTGLTLAQFPAGAPKFVGSEACAGCHQSAAMEWSASHHAWAWKLPTDATVKGNFEDAKIEHKGITTRFFKNGKRFIVETDGANGAMTQYRLHSTTGIAPLQQYLLETESGRLQALDLAWDTVKKRWYHLYPSQELKGGNGLHWTGPYKTWNARCAECHATGYKKNYDARTKQYSSTQAEIGVGCEACHGPGQAHLTWARVPKAYNPQAWPGLTAKGFTIGFKKQSAETEIQQCAGCHARREPLSDGNPLPGTPFHDAYRLSLLRPGLYHADGSIQDEVYVYGSFLQSKMYSRGVRCTDCHDPHAAKLKAEGNAVCTQCHSPAGNQRFATLKKASYDNPSHHFHALGSTGAQCKSCHMIERTYMGVDGRRDHSFRIPRPDLSGQTEAPNACTDCHSGKDASWAAREIERRFPKSTHRGLHYSQVFAKARKNAASVADALLEISGDKAQSGIVRATALNLIQGAVTPILAGRSAIFIGDADPLVRTAAISLQRAAAAQERVQRILPALEDKFRSVRIAAARVLLGASVLRLPARNTAALKSAQREWRASLMAKADFPETHLVLGGAALVLRNPKAADRAFREAVRQDPQLVNAWRMIIRIRAALGDRKGATEATDKALKLNPENQALHAMRKQLEASDRN
jgi:predicted CXXCH cytochrome family protein